MLQKAGHFIDQQTTELLSQQLAGFLVITLLISALIPQMRKKCMLPFLVLIVALRFINLPMREHLGRIFLALCQIFLPTVLFIKQVLQAMHFM